MSNKLSYSTRYFQLTSNILIEYQYTHTSIEGDQEGDVTKFIVDLKDNPSSVITNNYNSSKNFLDYSIKSGFVLPANRSESKFIQGFGTTENVWDALSTNIRESQIDVSGDDDADKRDVIFDNFRLHFTSRNIFGDYDGYIIRGIIFDKTKNKIALISHYIRRTDDVVLNPNPMILNQKLYTTYLDFRIPSVNALLNPNASDGEINLIESLSLGYDLLDNTPLVMAIYGVKATVDYHRFETYTTERINSIHIPSIDEYSELSVKIEEADDGDYFKIYPSVNDNKMSFSDYIYKLSGERPDVIIVLHEISLIENYTDNLNQTRSIRTHKEHYIINAGQSQDGQYINEDELDKVLTYRPILDNGHRCASFTIEDQMKILNTFDNTTVVKMGTINYGENDDENINKYGKKMNRIYLGEIPAQVNVYNKKPDVDTDNVKLTNASSNVKIENHQHSIIGFIESANVGVTVEQIPTSSIDQ